MKQTKRIVLATITICMLLMNVFTSSASEQKFIITSERMKEAQAELDALNPEDVMEQIKRKKANDLTIEYQISEYDLMSKLSEEDESKLKSAGYDDFEISNIKNYRKKYDEQLRTFSELHENILKALNYTDEQIYIIKHYKGTEDEMKRLSAKCMVTVDIDRCLYDSSTDRTSGRVTTSFVWNGVPVIKLTDALMTGWNEWYLAGKTANIKYTQINNGNTKWQTPSFITANNGGTSLGCGYSFKATIDDNYYYASEGYEIFTVDVSGKKDLFGYGLYAHRSVSATPSVSFSLTGTSVSISVNKTTEQYTGFDQMRVQFSQK